MKAVKTYESFLQNEFDINFVMAKIKSYWSEYDVINLVDEEIEEIIDDSNLTDKNKSGHQYETKREWYDDHGNGEAEELVAERIVDWYESEYNKILTEEQKSLIVKGILDEKTGFDSLQH